MPSSAIPATKAGLLETIQARAALATVQTGWARPGGILRETIYLGDARATETVWIGGRRATEVFTVDVVTEVRTEGDDPEAVETRAWALAAETEAAIAADRTLGGVQYLKAAAVTSKDQTNFTADGGRSTIVLLTVTCTAVIS